MKRYFLSPIVGLAIIVSSLAVATPANATFRLRNMYLGTCLGVSGGNPVAGAKMILWPCDGSANQKFDEEPTNTFNSEAEALFTLVNHVGDDRVLGVAPAPRGAVSAQVVTWTRDNSENQKWTMSFVGNDHDGRQCFAIRSNGTFTMLTPSGYNTSVGTVYHWVSRDRAGNVISESFGIPGGYGTADRGDPVIASIYVWGSRLMEPNRPWWLPPLPLYRPDTYSAQYWCKDEF